MKPLSYIVLVLAIFAVIFGLAYFADKFDTRKPVDAERRQSYSERGHNKHIVVTKERRYDDRCSWWITEIEIDGKKFLAIQATSETTPFLYPLP